MDTWQYIFVGIITFLAYFINSFVGFGSSSLAAAFLLGVSKYSIVIPALVLTRGLSYLFLLPSNIKKADFSFLKFLIVGSFFGTILGTFLLISVPSNILQAIFGVVIMLFGIEILFKGLRKSIPKNYYLDLFFGFLSGLMGTVFSTAGPSIAIYLSHKLNKAEVLRASMIAFFGILGLWKIITFTASGVWNLEILQFASVLFLPMILGTYLGNKISIKISEKYYKFAEAGILIVAGVLLIWW